MVEWHRHNKSGHRWPEIGRVAGESVSIEQLNVRMEDAW
jgi:hypothetical protein